MGTTTFSSFCGSFFSEVGVMVQLDGDYDVCSVLILLNFERRSDGPIRWGLRRFDREAY